MKTICALLLTLLCLTASAQKSSKLYAKIQKAQDKKEYYDMLTLLDKLPKEEHTTAQYNQLMAISLDSLHRYPSAIKYYTEYVNLSKDTAAAKRLAQVVAIEEQRIKAWNEKMVRIKDCPKCHGTDSVATDIECPKCLGLRKVKKACRVCYGKGTVACSNCGGTGSVSSGSGMVTCPKCGGARTSQCSMQCDHGYNMEDCTYCMSLGYKTVNIKCDKHD